MSKQSRAGTYYEPMPADFEILGRLPRAGIIGGVHWAGVPVRHIARDVREANPEADVPTTFIAARLRSMKVAGLVEDRPAVGGRIWAKTPTGVEHEAKREEILGA